MAEYIERSAILQKQTTMTEYDEGGWSSESKVVRVEDIESITTADVVEVVRCKDCKHGDAFDGNAVVIWCPYYEDQQVDPDHFCGYGERKDGAG